jgi:DNA repair exonuclease SbcCD ATPase subunit
MFIEKIELSNFGVIEETSLTFSKGLNLFSGKNGNGKSTIIRAIALVLFNRYSLSLKDYIQWGKDYFSVVVDFNHQGNSWQASLVYSEKKGTERHLFNNNTGEEWEGSSATNYLDKILDTERAIASILSFENEIDLIKTSPSKRRDYLKGIYDLNFKRQLEQIDADISASEKESVSAELTITHLENQTFELRMLNRKPFSEEVFNQHKENLETISSSIFLIEEKRDRLLASRRYLEKLKNDLILKEKEKVSFKELKEKKEKDLNSLEEVSEKIDEVQIKNKYKIEEENLKEKIQSFILQETTLKDSLEEKNGNAEELELRAKVLEKEVSEVTADLISISARYSIEKDHYYKMDEGVCPICGQDITEELLTKQKMILEDLRVQEASIRENNDCKNLNLKKLKKEIVELTVELNNINRLLRDNTQNLKESRQELADIPNRILNDIKNEKRLIDEKIRSQKEKEELIKEQIESYKNSLEYKIKEIRDLTIAIEEKEKEVQSFDLDDSLEEKKQKQRDLTDKIELYKTVISTNREKEKFNEEILQKKLERDTLLEKTQKQLEEVNEYLEVCKLSKKVVARELPSFILSILVKSLKKNVNEFLFKVYPKYEIDIVNKKKALHLLYGENKADVKMASGFETQIFSFSYKYALGKLQNYGLLLLDEVDSAADLENSTLFYEALGKLDAYFEQVFVITHKPDIKELLHNNYKARIFEINGGKVEE